MKGRNQKFVVFLLAAFGWMILSPTTSIFADDGEKTYKQFCVQCHGESGKGNEVNEEFLDTVPADFADTVAKVYFSKKTNEERFDVIYHGGKYTPKVNVLMPTFGGTLSEHQIGDLIAYLRTLYPNKAKPIDASGLSWERSEIDIKKISLGEPTRKEIKDGEKK